MFKNITKILFFIIFFSTISRAEIIKDIKIEGNIRIPDETVRMFLQTDVGSNINNQDLNFILKNVYDSNFFENVEVNLINQVLIIKVEEFPLIENVESVILISIR